MRKKTKVICAVTNDVNQDQRLQRICTTLIKNKFDVHLVGREDDRSRPLDNFKFPAIRLKCEAKKGVMFYVEYNYKLYKYLMETDFDIVNANDLDTILACSRAAKEKGKKLVFDSHEYFRLVPELQYRPVKRWIWHRMAKKYLKDSPYNYTVNYSIKNKLEEDYKIPFDVIHNFPYAKEALSYKLKHHPVRILYQGVLNKGRGLEILIEAMQHLSDMQLYIAGRGVLEPKLKKLISKYALNDRVKLFGFLSPRTLSKLTSVCDIGINILDPSSKSYYYSTANKFYDYIAAGIPTINMRFPEYEKIQSKHNVSFIIDNFSVDDIVSAIKKLAYNDKLYNTLSANAVRAHKELCWENEEMRLVNFYQQVSQ